jgi:hypothetical protein
MGSHEPWQQSLTAQLVSVLKGKEKNMIQLQYMYFLFKTLNIVYGHLTQISYSE